MSHKMIELQEGAIFISDAHYSMRRLELLSFFKAIESQEIVTTQIILFGDIFDALFGGVAYTYKENEELIALLQTLSKKISLIYLEGNHDFNLTKVFQDAQLFSIQNQPVEVKYAQKSILIAHGDYEGALGYKIYTSLIRNPIILTLLSIIDNLLSHKILKSVDAHLGKKDDCKELGWFEEFIKRRFKAKSGYDYIVEGHFHQNRKIELGGFSYINLGAFACNQRYFIVKSVKDKELLEEKMFSKGR